LSGILHSGLAVLKLPECELKFDHPKSEAGQ
jgi:hypothetical protein